MAAPSNAVTALRRIGMDDDVDTVATIVTNLNHVIGAVRAIATKLDADGGVTDTNYFSTIVDAAGSDPAAKITVREGL